MKRLAAILLTVAGITIPAGGAFAAWTVSNLNGRGTVAATTLPASPGAQSAAPNPAANSSTVRVQFSPVSFNSKTLGSYTGGGYEVTRYASSSGGVAVGTATICTASPCDVAGVPDGTWFFNVAPALEKWRGSASTRAQVVVDTTPPSGLTAVASVSSNKTLTLNGTAGTATGDVPSVTVLVCETDTVTCADSATIYSGPVDVVGGNWTVTPTKRVKNNVTYYVRVTQADAAGNVATHKSSFKG